MSDQRNEAKQFLISACEHFRDGGDEDGNIKTYELGKKLFGSEQWKQVAGEVGDVVAKPDAAAKDALRSDAMEALKNAEQALRRVSFEDAAKVNSLGKGHFSAEWDAEDE